MKNPIAQILTRAHSLVDEIYHLVPVALNYHWLYIDLEQGINAFQLVVGRRNTNNRFKHPIKSNRTPTPQSRLCNVSAVRADVHARVANKVYMQCLRVGKECRKNCILVMFHNGKESAENSREIPLLKLMLHFMIAHASNIRDEQERKQLSIRQYGRICILRALDLKAHLTFYHQIPGVNFSTRFIYPTWFMLAYKIE